MHTTRIESNQIVTSTSLPSLLAPQASSDDDIRELPSDTLDLDMFTLWHEAFRRKAQRGMGMAGLCSIYTICGVMEGEALLLPPGMEDNSPLVLAPGVTVTVSAGRGLHHGGGGSSTSSGGGVSLTFSRRDTDVDLTGPMTALDVVCKVSHHVMLECGRNELLQRLMCRGA